MIGPTQFAADRLVACNVAGLWALAPIISRPASPA